MNEYNAIYVKNTCSSDFIGEKIQSNSDSLLWLELGGSLKRKCKNYNISNDYFDRAENYYKERVDLKGVGENLSDIFFTTLVNQNVKEYNGNIFEAIMINVYKGLNFMSLGKKELARVEFNRALDRQRRARLEFKKQIEKKKKEIEKEEIFVKRAHSLDFLNEKYRQDLFRDFQAYPDFVNPFATYMAGLFFLLDNDYVKAADVLKESLAMEPTKKFLADDYRLAIDWLRKGQGEKKYIWLIYENGKVLEQVEFKINMPVFLASNKVMYSGIALPTLKENSASYSFLSLNDKNTELIADMDRIVKTEFQNKLPFIIMKSVTQAIAKIVIESQMSSRSELLGIGLSLYNIMTNRADVRSWVSLPKNFQAVRVENTGKGATIKTDGGEVLKHLDVPKDKNIVLFFSSSVPNFYVVHTILF